MVFGKRRRAKALRAFNATMTNRTLAATVGWGVFCAASWTWCIGMFLPFVLLAQFGWPGFWAFFVPNVLGCAAFGYVMTPARREKIRQRCGSVCIWFSLATLAYQAFFAGWMLSAPIAFGVVVVGIAAGRWIGDRGWLRLAFIATAASAVCIFSLGEPSLMTVPSHGTRPPESLLGLAPIIALGFLTCPYLDLTFHRALEKSPSRHAFLVFGFVFGATLLGIASLWNPLTNGPTVTLALGALWTIQLTFTIGAHAREGWSRRWNEPVDAPLRFRSGLAVVWVLLLGLTIGWLTRIAPSDWLGGGEAIYLRFLVLYGLVFPAFLLLRLRAVPVWMVWLTIVACLPFYEMGFLQNRTEMLFIPIGLLCVLHIASLDKARWKDRAHP